MADNPTYNDLVLAGRQEILRRPTRFHPEIVDTEGSDVNIVVTTGASMSDEAAGYSQQALNELSLSTAIKVGGEVLDRYLWDIYQLTRQGARPAVAQVFFSRSGDTSQSRTFPSGTVVSTQDGQTFETIHDVVFSIGAVGPFSVTANAQTTGPLGDSEIGAINVIITGIAGSTADKFTVTNPEPAAGGKDAETDEAFGERGRAFFVNARRGTRAAILTGALGTNGIAQATVLEDLTPDADPLFRVQVVVADDNGQANAALATDVKQELENFRALGVPVRVLASTPQYIVIEIDGITFVAGSNTKTIVDQVRASVVTLVNQNSPGAPLELATITTAIKAVRGVTLPNGAIVEPAGDVFPIGSATIRTTPDRVTINGESG